MLLKGTVNKGNHDREDVSIADLNMHRFLRFYFSDFSLVIVWNLTVVVHLKNCQCI